MFPFPAKGPLAQQPHCAPPAAPPSVALGGGVVEADFVTDPWNVASHDAPPLKVWVRSSFTVPWVPSVVVSSNVLHVNDPPPLDGQEAPGTIDALAPPTSNGTGHVPYVSTNWPDASVKVWSYPTLFQLYVPVVHDWVWLTVPLQVPTKLDVDPPLLVGPNGSPQPPEPATSAARTSPDRPTAKTRFLKECSLFFPAVLPLHGFNRVLYRHRPANGLCCPTPRRGPIP